MRNINHPPRARRRRGAHHHGTRPRRRSFVLLVLLLALVSTARAQQQFHSPLVNSLNDVPVTDTLKDAPVTAAAPITAPKGSPPPPIAVISNTSNSSPSQQQASQPEDEEDFIMPSRPGVVNPAEIHKAGVLQVEYGYDANFRSRELHMDQSAPLALRFAAASRLLLELDLDIFKSATGEATRLRETGIGDTRLGLQIVAIKETPQHPALAFAYYVKLPSASEAKGLGTGRYDHKLVFLLSKTVGEVDFSFNGAYLNNGRADGAGRASGGLAAFGFSREFESKFGFAGQLYGQSLDDAQARGVYALTALTYKANRRWQLDGGLRFGLTSDAPRVGVFAGMSVGVADFFGKGK